jgi:hypothetical protein
MSINLCLAIGIVLYGRQDRTRSEAKPKKNKEKEKRKEQNVKEETKIKSTI